MQAACQRGHQPLRTTLCQATQQQREEAAEAQLQEIAEQQATAEAAAEVPAAEDEEGAAAPPVRVKGGASNMGTGTKYALMSTLEENESIDAIEELQVRCLSTASFFLQLWNGVHAAECSTCCQSFAFSPLHDAKETRDLGKARTCECIHVWHRHIRLIQRCGTGQGKVG